MEQPAEGPAVGAYPKTAEDPHGVGPLRKWGAKTMERRTQIARMADGIMHMSLKEADQLVDRFLHLLRRPGQPGVLAVTVYATKLNLQNFSLRLQHSLEEKEKEGTSGNEAEGAAAVAEGAAAEEAAVEPAGGASP